MKNTAPLLPLVAAAGLVLGCSGKETGLLLTLRGPAVARVEVHVARSSCGVWTQQPGPPLATSGDLTGRDLAKSPFKLMIVPPSGSPDEILSLAAVGFEGDKAVATVYAQPLRFTADKVKALDLTLSPIAPTPFADPEGCFCHDAHPQLALASQPCSARIPAVAPVDPADTCPAIAPLLPRGCDGKAESAETPGRALPCFAHDPQGACFAGRRTCRDQEGIAYSAACAINPAWKLADEFCALYAEGGIPCQDPLIQLQVKARPSARQPPVVCGVSRGFALRVEAASLAALPLGTDSDVAPDVVQFASGGDPVAVTSDPVSSPIVLVIVGDPPSDFQIPVLVVENLGNVAVQQSLRTYHFTTAPCSGGADAGTSTVDGG